MSQPRKTLDTVLTGQSDQNIRFSDLRTLITRMGFTERVKGDHFIYIKSDIPEIINLQPRRDNTAKPYQVKQVRRIVTTHRLVLER